MADNKPRQKMRAHRESKHQHGSGGKGPKLTPLQGVLINSSGPIGHRLRSQGKLIRAPKRRPKGD